MPHTLSFTILNENQSIRNYLPIHVEIKDLEYKTIYAEIQKIAENLESDPSHIFFDYDKEWDYHVEHDDHVDTGDKEFSSKKIFLKDDIQEIYEMITKSLTNQKYFVRNRCEKYYSFCVAIDYTRFEIFQKGFDKELIKWRENDQNDPVKGIITNKNYNENPVITAMKQLQNVHNVIGLIDD